MTVEVTVFQLDSGAIGCLGDEPDLGLAGFSRVGHDLPLRADVPTEDDPVWWIKGENTRPTTLTSVLAAVEDVAADERFETAARRALDAGDPTASRCRGPVRRRPPSRRLSSRRTFTTVLRSQGWTTSGTKTHRPAIWERLPVKTLATRVLVNPPGGMIEGDGRADGGSNVREEYGQPAAQRLR